MSDSLNNRPLESPKLSSSARSKPPSRISSSFPLTDTSERDNSTRVEDSNYYTVEDQGQKEDGSPDWYVEGPGRRVGYDDLTAIDWIYEYAKERQRLKKLLALNHGLVGNLRLLFDASHVWFVLVASGISVGCVAAFINIASDWLGDIKTGYCKTGAGGGQFYLNKQFCCWGHDKIAQCQDWTPWPSALGVGPAGAQYVISYIFFVIFSVRSHSSGLSLCATDSLANIFSPVTRSGLAAFFLIT